MCPAYDFRTPKEQEERREDIHETAYRKWRKRERCARHMIFARPRNRMSDGKTFTKLLSGNAGSEKDVPGI